MTHDFSFSRTMVHDAKNSPHLFAEVAEVYIISTDIPRPDAAVRSTIQIEITEYDKDTD